MSQDERLDRLMKALSELIGSPIHDAGSTIGELGIDSKYLPEIILACEDVYGGALDFDAIEIGYETSLLSLHRQVSARSPLSRAGPD